ncbi:MAG: hypothetical protein QXR69_02110 [Conexivisphaerales archaeon]
MTSIEVEDEAAEVLELIRRERGEPYVTLVEDGCCAFSNVFVRLDMPDDNFIYLGKVRTFDFFIRKDIAPLYEKSDIILHAIRRIDDSFSAETEFGYKLTIDYSTIGHRAPTFSIVNS